MMLSIQKTVFAISFLLSIVVNGQSLNNYEYIIIPEQFEFQSSPHEYDVNRLTQFLFNKYNFKALIKGELLPEGTTICDVLQATVIGEGFLKTKLNLKLSDCQGEIIYASPEGTSRKKDYKQAYHEAIRSIFNDPRLKLYEYIPFKKSEIKASKDPLVSDVIQSEDKNLTKGALKTLKGKRTVKTPTKTTGASLIFELREKQYIFQPIGKNYIIKLAEDTIGEAFLNPDKVSYTLKAGALSGTGVFDDYGNFELNRVNPLTQKSIKDVLVRIN